LTVPGLLDERARLAAHLAALGGHMARERFQHATVMAWKTDGSMLTAADVEIQQRLETEIAAHFPQDDVLGEEMPTAGLPLLRARHWWIIDPIDGTNNFGRHVPGFCVSVGIFQDGLPWAGAVYDPLTDWLFAATIGVGAWLNGTPLRLTASELSGRSHFSVRSPFVGGIPPFVQEWFQRYRLRRVGSTALQLCYVALGGIAFVHDHAASIWDVAGALPVLIEAGGRFTGVDGVPLFPIAAERVAAPIAFLAGDLLAHRQIVTEIARLANAVPSS